MNYLEGVIDSRCIMTSPSQIWGICSSGLVEKVSHTLEITKCKLISVNHAVPLSCLRTWDFIQLCASHLHSWHSLPASGCSLGATLPVFRSLLLGAAEDGVPELRCFFIKSSDDMRRAAAALPSHGAPSAGVSQQPRLLCCGCVLN